MALPPAKRLLWATPLVLLAVTWLDGAALADRLRFGQALADALTLAFWSLVFLGASPRLRRLLVLGLVAATAGEVIFSLGLGMYLYRLARIPLYVPPGHTLLYATVFVFVRARGVRRHAGWLAPMLMLAATAYSLAWFRVARDAFGLACFGAFALLWMLRREARLFFAAMYLLVAFLEQCGTHFGAWRWPPLLFGRVAACPSGNPPSGVALFYVLFDLACLALYFGVRWTSFERWVQRLVFRRGINERLRQSPGLK